jgi:hypothetical protein
LTNTKKSKLAIAMSTAALATFGVLAPHIASAAFQQCDYNTAYGCGSWCHSYLNDDYSCCGTMNGGVSCNCFPNPVDCSFMFS